MAKNFVQPGQVIDFTAGENIASGDGVAVGTMLGVALSDIALGGKGAVQIEGVFDLPKLSTAAVAVGQKLIWDVSEDRFIVTGAAAGDLNNCAVAIEADAGGTHGSPTIKAKLTPGVGTVQGT